MNVQKQSENVTEEASYGGGNGCRGGRIASVELIDPSSTSAFTIISGGAYRPGSILAELS
ncbi:hypothetical protein DY000_02026493 [Brassica cretica]|uniref:Uncharacterized protein n=1 Tax=Brassica cretica TaxID=69181 RepID=A0ABQ7EEZ7_BRACR|nr:hypothetical protein DY000_02026493 [Brassica cretica]